MNTVEPRLSILIETVPTSDTKHFFYTYIFHSFIHYYFDFIKITLHRFMVIFLFV